MMMKYYPDGKVKYSAFKFTSHLSDDVVSIPSSRDFKNIRTAIADVYPFSIFATDAMISLMSETNRLNAIDECLWDINSGQDFKTDDNAIAGHIDDLSLKLVISFK